MWPYYVFMRLQLYFVPEIELHLIYQISSKVILFNNLVTHSQNELISNWLILTKWGTKLTIKLWGVIWQ